MTGPELAMASTKQMTKIVMQLDDLHVRDRTSRLAIVSALTGKTLLSMRELTFDQAHLLIDELEQILAAPDPIGELAGASARAAQRGHR